MLKTNKVGNPKRYSWNELRMNFPRKLPHYKERETRTIKKFIELGILPGDYIFDFRLPYELSDTEKLYSASEQRMLIALKSMRLDAVVETKDCIWVLEACNGLELSYTGKLIGYADIYKELYKPDLPVKLGVIGLKENTMARRALERMGVKIWLVTI